MSRKYNELANRTEPDYAQYKRSAENAERHIEVLHHVIGISSESGELMDTVKKTVFYNKPLNVENICEEIGDLKWYIRGLLHALVEMDEVGFSDVTELENWIEENNLAKLEKRYPEKFTFEDAEKRADKNDTTN